jgi:fluoride exporter
MTALLVIAGAALGAPLRYLVDLFVQSRHDGLMPWGTLAVNVSGALLLGVVAGVVDATGSHEWLLALLGTGFCGALTTFSTFSFETMRLLEENAFVHAAANVGLSVVAGVVALFGGWSLAATVF